MSLSSLRFIIFFVVVYLLLCVSKLIRIKNKRIGCFTDKLILLAASYVFLGLENWKYCVYLIVLTLIVYIVTLRIEIKSIYRKLTMSIGVTFCILGLCFFKYWNFFAETFTRFFTGSIPYVNMIAPIGISFYTFSAIGYIIDVYRSEYKAESDILSVALYLSFFPKLVSGPLMSAKNFFDQLKQLKGVGLKNLEIGIQLFVIGLLKKIVLADHLGIFVDDVYKAPGVFSSATIVLAVISYSLQLYFDFSGYSDMAIGISKIIGFDIEKNFNLPYISTNLTEFWKRWHISLSSWLQKYLYFSLGGNRKGKIRTYVNLFLVMLMGGLWHGAGWTFVVWGILHGIGLVIHKLFMEFKCKKYGNKNAGNFVWKVCSCAITFSYVTFCWIFFRALDFNGAVSIIRGLVIHQTGIVQIYTWSILAIVLFVIGTVYNMVRGRFMGKQSCDVYYPLQKLSTFKGLLFFFLICGITIGIAYFGDTAFIYGKF